MGVTALLMAGGKGTRMKGKEEKPLIKVGGKPLIEHVLNALKNAKKIDKIVVAVSENTLKTAKVAKKFQVKVIKTPGRGFCLDARYAIKKLKLNTVLTISVDLPLVTGEVIDKVIEHYERCGKPALCVMAPPEIYKRLGIDADYIFEVEGRALTPVGINVVDGKKINEERLEEEVFVITKEEIAVNVNRRKDIEIAERFLKRKAQTKQFIC
jgi:adenosylcobinamide-phosphate guanylyltransferase